MTPTDTTALDVPSWLEVPDRNVLGDQRVTVRSAWWQKHLDARGLPGGPVQVRKDDSGEFLTRADVWGIAANADADPTHNNGNSGLGSGVAAVGLVANGLPDRPWGLLHE